MVSTLFAKENIWSNSLFITLVLLMGLLSGLAVNLIGNPLIIILASIALMGGVLAVARPDIGLIFLVFIVYSRISDNLIDLYNVPSVAKLFVLLMFLIVVWRWYFFDERPEGWGLPAALLMIYGLWGMFSLLYADRPELTRYKIVDYAKDALIAITVIMLMFRGTRFRQVVWTLITVGLVVGTVSVYQYATGTYGEDYLGFGQADYKQIAGRAHEYRIAGQIGDPNFYGQITLVLVPLALDRFFNEKRAFPRFIAGWATIVTIFAIIFTFSRGAFIGLVLIIAAMMIINKVRPLTILAAGIVIVILMQFAPSSYFERVQTLADIIPGVSTVEQSEDASLRGRNDKAKVAIQMTLDNPVAGVGLGNYRPNYIQYLREINATTNREANDAHSLYLEVAAEQGFIGLGIFCSIIAAALLAVRHSYRVFKELRQSDYANMTLAIGLGFIGYIITAAFLHSSFPRFFWLLFALCIALPEVARFEKQHVKQQLAGFSSANRS